MLRQKSTSRLITMLLVITCGAQIIPLYKVKAVVIPPDTVSTVQLHRFLNSTAHHIYTTDADFKLTGGKYEGAKGWVLTKKVSGDTVPVFSLHKDDEPIGRRHFYTTDMDEANNAINNLGWAVDTYLPKGIAFYIAATQVPNTEALFRLYYAPTDDHFYTTDVAERNKAIASGYKFEKIAGYVWRTPQTFDLAKADPLNPGPKLPDLLIQEIADVKDTSVTVVLRNDGEGSLKPHATDITLTAYNAKNQILFTVHKELEHGLSSHQADSVTIDTNGQSLFMTHFYVLVDTSKKVEESNELNNVSKVGKGPMLVIKLADDPLKDLKLALKLAFIAKQDRSAGGPPQFVYTLSITNWVEVPAAMFADAPSLPPCGKKSSGPRTWIYILNQNGKMLSQICWITSPSTLQKLIYAAKPGEAVPEQLIVGLEDRQTGKTYKSNPVSVK